MYSITNNKSEAIKQPSLTDIEDSQHKLSKFYCWINAVYASFDQQLGPVVYADDCMVLHGYVDDCNSITHNQVFFGYILIYKIHTIFLSSFEGSLWGRRVL